MLDLSALEAPGEGPAGQPLVLPLELVDEDPEQPRVEFDEASLRELAETIRERGVRQPVSVRPHPTSRGRWMLNFGARRLRASRLAGRSTIPAFVDTAADSYDQVIENEQRLGLTHMELALFVKRRMACGDSQSTIARQLGKSKALVTYSTALIDPPDWLIELYRSSVCTGIAELYELRRLHELHGALVEAWARSREAISRRDVIALKGQLPVGDVKGPREVGVVGGSRESGSMSTGGASSSAGAPVGAAQAGEGAPVVAGPARRRLTVVAEWADRAVHLLLDVVPAQAGSVYVRPEAGGERVLVPLGQLSRLRVAELVG